MFLRRRLGTPLVAPALGLPVLGDVLVLGMVDILLSVWWGLASTLRG